MPIVRGELLQFVEMWNKHRIRLSRGRPNHVPGVPQLLYRYPARNGGEESGIAVPSDDLAAIEAELQGFGR